MIWTLRLRLAAGWPGRDRPRLAARPSGRTLVQGLTTTLGFVGSLIGGFWAATVLWRDYFFDKRIVPALLVLALGLTFLSGLATQETVGDVRRRDFFEAMLMAWVLGLALFWRWRSRPRRLNPSRPFPAQAGRYNGDLGAPMTITPEQKAAIERSGSEPVRVEDPETKTAYLIVREDVYRKLFAVYRHRPLRPLALRVRGGPPGSMKLLDRLPFADRPHLIYHRGRRGGGRVSRVARRNQPFWRRHFVHV